MQIKIPLVKKPTTRPMSIAYHPKMQNYYIADGGLAPMGTETEAPFSKSEVHTYSASGQYVSSTKPGFDNRSIYFNSNTGRLETITYNVSSEVGFSPNTGIYALSVNEKGEVTEQSDELSQFNPAFGSAGAMPSFDAAQKRYFVKQARGNKVLIVDPTKREAVGEITLALEKAGAAFDDVSDTFVAYTGNAGEELALLDVDHKAILVFDVKGNYVGKSELAKTMKLRANNHYSGLGYTNGMMFVYHEPEGEFGTYYGFKFLRKHEASLNAPQP